MVIGPVIVMSQADVVAQQRRDKLPADSARRQLLRMSLAEEFAFHVDPSYEGGIEPKDVCILDSNIVSNDLPAIPKGRLVPVSIGKVDSLARRGNEIDYIFLASLKLDSGIARVKWNWMTAVFSRRFGRVVHRLRRSDEGSYRLTKNGWTGGLTGTVNYDLERPE